MEFRELDWNEIKKTYEQFLVHDFIPQETKPLARIKQLFETGHYPCFGLFDGEALRAYAFLASAPETGFFLLDYFAVVEGFRGSGCGGTMLEKLKERFLEKGLILEVENGCDMVTKEEKEICERRLRFYGHHGICHTDFMVMLWGKPLDIYHFSGKRQEEVYEGLKAIYRVIYSEEDRKQNVTIYQRLEK